MIDTDQFSTLELKNNGPVVANGNNEHGQCDLQDWTNILYVIADFDLTIGVKTDGTLVVAGKTEYLPDLSGWTGLKVTN